VKTDPGAFVAQGYSLLMYKEFFIGRLAAATPYHYAVTHTVVVCSFPFWPLLFFRIFCLGTFIREVLLAFRAGYFQRF
jgi:hypothetical protein